MKSIKEKQFLVNLAKALGQNADPNLVKEINSFNAIKKDAHDSIKKNALKDLTEAFKQAKLETEVKQIIEYPLPPTLDEVLNILEEETPKDELVQPQTEEAPVRATEEPIPEPTLAERAAKVISEAPKRDSFQQPDPDPVAKNFDAIQSKLKFLEQAISKIAVTGPGGGEVNQTFMVRPTRTVVTNTYSITQRDYYIGVYYAGAVTLTLPDKQPNGKVFIVKDEYGEASRGTNRYITVLPTGNDLIDGRSRAILAYDFGSLTFIFKNGNWRVI